MSGLVALETWAQWLVLLPLAGVLATAAITDARERKVYNWLTYPAFVGGLVIHTIVLGWSGLGAGLLAALVTLVLGLFMLPLGWMGGGDIKLLAAVGALLGLKGLGEVFFYSVLAGGIIGLLMALFSGYLWAMLKRLFRFLRGLVRLVIYRTSNVVEPLEQDPRSRMPFAVAIFAGGVLAWLDAFYGWPGLLARFLAAYNLA